MRLEQPRIVGRTHGVLPYDCLRNQINGRDRASVRLHAGDMQRVPPRAGQRDAGRAVIR